MNQKNFSQKILPTKFDGYYVSEDGKVFTEWYSTHIKGTSGCISKKGSLRELKQHPRGGSNPTDRYLAINISLKNAEGKTEKQIKYYVHRLIAECFLENPHKYKEIDHIDSNKLNNHANNLKWVSRKENMIKITAKQFKLLDGITGEVYSGTNLTGWIEDNWNWIQLRTRTKTPKAFAKSLHNAISSGSSCAKLKKI
jgi:hypothetical protein